MYKCLNYNQKLKNYNIVQSNFRRLFKGDYQGLYLLEKFFLL